MEKNTILVLDKDEESCKSISNLLQRSSYACSCFRNAHDALEAVSERHFDLVIVDTDMAENANLELVRQIQEHCKPVPFILVAAEPSIDAAIGAIELPVVAYLKKPLDNDRLLTSVRQGIQRGDLFKLIETAKQQLRDQQEQLQRVGKMIYRMSRSESQHAIDIFVSHILSAVVTNLNNLKVLSGLNLATQDEKSMQLARTIVALLETVETLKQTKLAFKSKELGTLRKNLERLVKDFEVRHIILEEEEKSSVSDSS